MPRLKSIHLFGLDGLANVGQVTEGIYRGADPSPEGYKALADLGVRTVLNLSHGRDRADLSEYGIREIYKPLDFFGSVDEARINSIVDGLCDTSLHPIYIHCAQGRDRTGMVIACYRIKSGWTNKDAIDEMWSFGFHFVWSHFLEFVQVYQGGG